jgi:translation elongation factor EF-G
MSIDYPSEPSIRLIRRELVEEFRAQMDTIRAELEDAVQELNTHFDEIIEEMRVRRGDAFNISDYPPTLLNSFSISYDFPSVECASEIRTLNPQLWLDECSRIRENLDSALYRAEEEYRSSIVSMIEGLTERLTPNPDGSKKKFRSTSVTNISDFIETFRATSIGSTTQMQELVSRFEAIVGDTSADTLRKSQETAGRLVSALNSLKEEVTRVQSEEELRSLDRTSKRRTAAFIQKSIESESEDGEAKIAAGGVAQRHVVSDSTGQLNLFSNIGTA